MTIRRKLEEKQEPQQFLSQASDILSSSLDYETTLKTVARLAVPYLSDVCIVYMKQHDSSIRRIAIASVDRAVGKVTQEMRRRFLLNPKAKTGVPQVIRVGKSVLYATASAKILSSDVYKKKDLEHLLKPLRIKSWMCVPLSARGRTFGAISFISAKSERHYTKDDVRIAEELGQRAGLAVDNARLFHTAQEELVDRKKAEKRLLSKQRQQQAVTNLGKHAIVDTSTMLLMKKAVRIVAKSLDVEYATILKFLPHKKEFLVRAGVGWKRGIVGKTTIRAGKESQTGYTFLSKRPVFVKDLQTETRFLVPLFVQEHEAKSSISVIIQGKLQPIGVLIVHAKKKRHFSKDDISFLQAIAHIIAATIERKLGQEALRASEEQLRTSRDQLEVIFQSVDDGITVQDKKGMLIYANDAAAKIIGFSSVEELMNTAPLEIVKKFELLDEFGNRISIDELPGRRVLKGEHPPEMLVRYLVKETGEEKWSMLKATPVFSQDNKVQFAINIFTDITQQKFMEKQKDEFFAIASHELKTPVTSIKAFTQIMKKRITAKEDKESLYYISKMETQLQKLTNLIGDLLDISKIQAGKLLFNEEVFAIDTLIKETLEDIQQTVEQREIILKGKTKKMVFGDRDRIGQVLTNLITNAIKYSKDNKKIIVQLVNDLEMVKISVQDFGIGISKIDQKKVFERFFQAFIPKRETYPGLGVGLYISSEIIKRHKGRIWVESKKGEGSTFFFTLPIYRRKNTYG